MPSFRIYWKELVGYSAEVDVDTDYEAYEAYEAVRRGVLEDDEVSSKVVEDSWAIEKID